MKSKSDIISVPSLFSYIYRRCIYAMLFLGLSFSLLAHQHDTLSLIKRIETNRNVNEKVKDLLILCDTLENDKNYIRLGYYAQLALDYASNIADNKAKTEAYYYLTRVYLADKNVENLEKHARKGLELATLTNNIRRQAYFYHRIGIVERKKGNVEKAIASYEKAIEQCQMVNDSFYLASSLNNLSICYQDVDDYNNAYETLVQLLEIRLQMKDSSKIATAYFNLGNNFESHGNNQKAIENYIKSLDLYEALGNLEWQANCLFSIGLAYHNIENFNESLNYYNQAKEIAIKNEDNYLLAIIHQNLGNIVEEQGDYTRSIAHHITAISLFEEMEDQESINMVLQNLGHTYFVSGKIDSAKQVFLQAYKNLQSDPFSDDFANVNIELGRLYAHSGHYKLAKDYLRDGLEFSSNGQDISMQSFANLYMFQVLEKTNNHSEALKYYKEHIRLKDSLNILDQEEAITRIMAPFNFEKQQAEIALLNKENELKASEVQKAATQKNLLYILLGFMSFIIIGTYYQFQFAKRKNKIITLEKERAEVLLLNILPSETAEELKLKGSVDAKRFDQVTVLFTDFVDFTKFAESVTPEDVVKSVDYYFSEFDKIVERNGVEKIKTIGDAYMCVGGLPIVNTTNPIQVVTAAKEIMHVIQKTKADPPEGIHPFDIRIGINTGPVVAGVVGIHKFQYDIWGNTVNVASRMESNCVPGEINLSESTYNLVKEVIPCEYIGDANLKHHSKLKMFKVI